MILPEVGAKGQARLGAAHALLIGAGGLGAPVLQYLAGAGVGMLTIVDPDRVDLSNLHRQTLFSEEEVGEPKSEAAAAFVERLNGAVAVRPVVARLDPANADRLLGGVDIALDCADSFAASYTLSDACFAASVPMIGASVLGMEGYAGGFCGGAPSLRAVFSDLPARAASCATAGVLGPVVGMVGALQAQMALWSLLGHAPSPLGQLTQVTGVPARMQSFRFDGAAEPKSPFRFIAPGEIEAADFVLELRGEAEAPVPVAPHAQRAEAAMAAAHVPGQAQRAVMVCRSGLRAWQAATALRQVWDGEIVLAAMGDP
ncbi:MAG: HesA/MoeB/ThiF family protein [Pseudomonadota bacterium]